MSANFEKSYGILQKPQRKEETILSQSLLYLKLQKCNSVARGNEKRTENLQGNTQKVAATLKSNQMITSWYLIGKLHTLTKIVKFMMCI